MTVRVLIASTVFRRAKILEKPLTDAGFTVVVATSGPDGLALCRQGRVDVVLLEGHQSGLDGFGFCRILKGDASLRHLPVGLVTEQREPRQGFRALSSGADECFPFPMEEGAFIRRMRSLADLRSLEDGLRCALAIKGCDTPLIETDRISVLVLDHDQRSRQRLGEVLSPDFSVTCAEQVNQAISHMAAQRFGVVVSDFGGLAGAGSMSSLLLHQLHLASLSGGLRLIGLGEADGAPEVGFGDVLLRPIDRNEALMRVRIAVRKHGLSQAIRTLESGLEPACDRARGIVRNLTPGRLAA